MNPFISAQGYSGNAAFPLAIELQLAQFLDPLFIFVFTGFGYCTWAQQQSQRLFPSFVLKAAFVHAFLSGKAELEVRFTVWTGTYGIHRLRERDHVDSLNLQPRFYHTS